MKMKIEKRVTNVLHFYLFFKPQPLFKWVVQFSIGIAELFATHKTFKTFTKAWTRAVPLGKWGHYLWMTSYQMTE